jgi:class 3 adenylate cyclase
LPAAGVRPQRGGIPVLDAAAAGLNHGLPVAQYSLDSSIRVRETSLDSTGTPGMDVSTWLRDLGLEDYVQRFQAHHIDAKVLPRLTAHDLTALGITSVGHRRKLLDAIAALDQRRAATAAEPSTVAARPVEAERRQLTVLFCDLVGSTELATRLDPEDLREVMRAYQKACACVIGRFDGHLARFLGDGVLAYFGWPGAHEDDAERAVRAGLQLVGDVARLEPRPGMRLQARVGVATGHVVVGDLIGEGVSDKDAVSGDTPNLAARVQALAAPGSVVISQATRRLVGGLFELTDLGPQRLKGFAEPLSAWQVEGQGRAEGRFEARHSAGLTPLVGREEEIALLLRLWRQARDGEGQGSASHASYGSCASASPPSPVSDLPTSAPLITRPVHCTRWSKDWSAPRDSSATTRPRRGSPSSRRSWPAARTSSIEPCR